MKYLEEAKNILKVWWTKEIKGKSHINITAIHSNSNLSWMLNKKNLFVHSNLSQPSYLNGRFI